MKKEKIKLTAYNDNDLIYRLRKNPKELDKFKKIIIEEFACNSDINGLLYGLKIILRAQRGTAAAIASKSGMHRVGIYKALEKSVRPRIDTLRNILNGVGLDIAIKKIA